MSISTRKLTGVCETPPDFDKAYDLVLVALGFERRSREFAEKFKGDAAVRIASGFEDRHVLSYFDNKKSLENMGFEITELSDASYLQWWRKKLDSVRVRNRPIRICVDVSSQTRARIAFIVEGIFTWAAMQDVEVDFFYSLAKYSGPGCAPQFAAVCGPVTQFFAGWPPDPDFPASIVIGLGYEAERAIGAFEYLEPTVRVVLNPKGRDGKYDAAVIEANGGILESTLARDLYDYRVDRPADTFLLVKALIHELISETRVILLPFGPKLFALSCLLNACLHYPKIGVWRVSPGVNEEPQERYASETLICVNATFSRSA